MSTGYQIFSLETDFDTKSTAIDGLFGFPTASGDTICYREKIKSDSEELWAGVVKQDLVDACASMTPSERLVFYDDSDLKDAAYLDANGWFPTP